MCKNSFGYNIQVQWQPWQPLNWYLPSGVKLLNVCLLKAAENQESNCFSTWNAVISPRQEQEPINPVSVAQAQAQERLFHRETRPDASISISASTSTRFNFFSCASAYLCICLRCAKTEQNRSWPQALGLSSEKHSFQIPPTAQVSTGQ